MSLSYLHRDSTNCVHKLLCVQVKSEYLYLMYTIKFGVYFF